MLYIAPIFKIDGMKKSFENADDVVILEISQSINKNSIKIVATIIRVLEWGNTEGLTFDPGNAN